MGLNKEDVDQTLSDAGLSESTKEDWWNRKTDQLYGMTPLAAWSIGQYKEVMRVAVETLDEYLEQFDPDEKRTVELLGLTTVCVSQRTAAWLFNNEYAREDLCT